MHPNIFKPPKKQEDRYPKRGRSIYSTLEEQVEKRQVKNQQKNPLFVHIFDSRIPKSLEKPLKAHDYNGKGDPIEHEHHVDGHLNYYHIDKLQTFLTNIDQNNVALV